MHTPGWSTHHSLSLNKGFASSFCLLEIFFTVFVSALLRELVHYRHKLSVSIIAYNQWHNLTCAACVLVQTKKGLTSKNIAP